MRRPTVSRWCGVLLVSVNIDATFFSRWGYRPSFCDGFGQVSALMKELAVPDKTKCMASKAAVDLHDHLKRDMMTLFSLEKILQKKVRAGSHPEGFPYPLGGVAIPFCCRIVTPPRARRSVNVACVGVFRNSRGGDEDKEAAFTLAS